MATWITTVNPDIDVSKVKDKEIARILQAMYRSVAATVNNVADQFNKTAVTGLTGDIVAEGGKGGSAATIQPGVVTAEKIQGGAIDPSHLTTNLAETITSAVPNSTTVNGHALQSDVILAASDLQTGTLPHPQLPALEGTDIPDNAANTTGKSADLASHDRSAETDWHFPTVKISALPVYATNVAALAGGLTAGQLYRTGGATDSVSIVH